jgi:hypothetical protein
MDQLVSPASSLAPGHGWRQALFAAAALSLGATLAACASHGGGGGGPGPGQTGSCLPAATSGGGEAAAVPGTVSGTLVDEAGGPVAGQPVLLCGLDLCSAPGETGPSGAFSVSFGRSEKRPALRIGDGVAYAAFAIPFTGPDAALGTLTTAHLPSTGAALVAGATAVSGDVSVAIPAGASVAIDGLTYGTADERALRTRSIPVGAAAAQLASAKVGGVSAHFGLLVGLAPAATTICPPARVTVALPHGSSSPNDLGWAPGAAVEFWVTGRDVGQAFAPYAGWAWISDGVVSADGRSASTSDGQGLTFLETFAVRLK